jgi:ABC-type transport system involved in cytochrome c biogenesis ATPase subunit
MSSKTKLENLKLRHLKIKNFKAFDDFEIDFPAPEFSDDPDVIVLGSKNGLGKTSLLEACSLLYIFSILGEDRLDIDFKRLLEFPVNLYDLLIRSGSEKSTIEGLYTIGDRDCTIKINISRDEKIHISGDYKIIRELWKNSGYYSPEIAAWLTFSLIGLTSDTICIPSFMYFHSYRKIQEGNPELGMMVREKRFLFRRMRHWRGSDFPVSMFKLEILRSIMSQADLFENINDDQAGDSLSKLNELLKRYAGGTIQKLRTSPDSTVDLRIYPNDGGNSFPFDGLSSGQKEIISTLFLIWYYSQNAPGIVLIDEPELHLNAEWHRDFVRQVHKLAPQNQYIIATHSEDIFSSVDASRRVLLAPAEVKPS